LGCGERSARRASAAGEPRYDFVLHFKQIGDGLIEAFGPDVISCFGINEPHVHSKPAAVALHGTFEHVTDVQLPPDLPNVNCPPLI
jgi:hypothetical protein